MTFSAMEDPASRKERLRALREAARLADDQPHQAEQAEQAQPTEEPVLKFRNYVPRDDKIDHEKVEAAQPPKFEEPKPEADIVAASTDAEVLMNVAPKKANWDLQRDVAPMLEKLERRTIRAMITLMQQEEQRRLQEDGGIQD